MTACHLSDVFFYLLAKYIIETSGFPSFISIKPNIDGVEVSEKNIF